MFRDVVSIPMLPTENFDYPMLHLVAAELRSNMARKAQGQRFGSAPRLGYALHGVIVLGPTGALKSLDRASQAPPRNMVLLAVKKSYRHLLPLVFGDFNGH